MGIHGANYEDFNDFNTLTYDVSLLSYSDMTQQIDPLLCQYARYCQITMSRSYTPILYSVNP